MSAHCVFEEVGKEWCEEKRDTSLVVTSFTRQGRYHTCTGSETYYKKKCRQSQRKGMQGNAKRDQGMTCSGDMENISQGRTGSSDVIKKQKKDIVFGVCTQNRTCI